MMIDLVWIVAAYAAAAYCVHWRISRMSKESAGGRHFVLVAGNHQMQIEGYIRKLRGFSRWTGEDIAITVAMKALSADETGKIASLLASREQGELAVVPYRPGEPADIEAWRTGTEPLRTGQGNRIVVWIDLDDLEHARLPQR
ncbi:MULTISPECIES: hypothetical protein [Cohnella]|uniref:hypothetical protein n=1 Tax=Cohnella TaxID=329857 RepID=UPI0009BC1643|nr:MULTISPECIES: hypothetical protein [Cohnella]MBN2980643.1 hypothetical protein [Cohnella algarum]